MESYWDQQRCFAGKPASLVGLQLLRLYWRVLIPQVRRLSTGNLAPNFITHREVFVNMKMPGPKHQFPIPSYHLLISLSNACGRSPIHPRWKPTCTGNVHWALTSQGFNSHNALDSIGSIKRSVTLPLQWHFPRHNLHHKNHNKSYDISWFGFIIIYQPEIRPFGDNSPY